MRALFLGKISCACALTNDSKKSSLPLIGLNPIFVRAQMHRRGQGICNRHYLYVMSAIFTVESRIAVIPHTTYA